MTPTMSPINAFPVEDLHTPEFSKSLQENTSYWQEPNPHEYPVEQVMTSPPKTKKLTRNCQKRTIPSDDAPRVRTTKKEIVLAQGWLAISKSSKHDSLKCQEIALPKFATESEGGSKRHKSSSSSLFNTESREASININTNVGDNDKDEV
ncbi:hypothetical protein Tco_0019354 [Tanacetum coccineum]